MIHTDGNPYPHVLTSVLFLDGQYGTQCPPLVATASHRCQSARITRANNKCSAVPCC